MTAVAQQGRVTAVIRLVRPLDWSKNSFVFAGILFSHRWNDLDTLWSVGLAFLAYCGLASSVYVFNDLRDRESDRHHPKKKNRPIASGAISPGFATVLGVVLMAAALLGAWLVSPAAAGFALAYLVLNVAYTLRLKQVVLLDVFIIAAGFVLRILVGTVGVNIPPSPWILVCGLSLSLFLGFCKRRSELIAAGEDKGRHRAVLDRYSERDLEQMIVICAACAIVAYSLYTIDPTTIQTHGTQWLIATVPFVIYGILRYIHLLHRGIGGGRAATDLLRDQHLLTTIVGWIATTLFLLL